MKTMTVLFLLYIMPALTYGYADSPKFFTTHGVLCHTSNKKNVVLELNYKLNDFVKFREGFGIRLPSLDRKGKKVTMAILRPFRLSPITFHHEKFDETTACVSLYKNK